MSSTIVSVEDVFAYLQHLEELLQRLIGQKNSEHRDATPEMAVILNRSSRTVNRAGRVTAGTHKCRRSQPHGWMLSHAELIRIQNRGWLERSAVG